MTIAERVAGRVSQAAAARFGRRGFLTRSAVVGSALATAPVDYVLRPVTAYAAICRCGGQACACGSPCCSGFTEFCCSITGENRCPPGTTIAGWWKVGGSNFCGGGDRYYFDCNAGCGTCGCGSAGLCGGSCSGTSCGCANGDCDLRRSGCILFRYGQCNNQVPCVGPIVCRVVGCIPPWELDATCSPRPFTNEATRFHDAACLHRPVGSVDRVERSGESLIVRGWALVPDSRPPAAVRLTNPRHGDVVVAADLQRDDIADHYPGHGPFHGFEAVVTADAGWCVGALGSPTSGVETPLGCIGSGEPVTGVGYWLVERSGVLHPFGVAADALGSIPRIAPSHGATVVDIAVSGGGQGLVALDSDGRVHTFGRAPDLGSPPSTVLDADERWATIVTPPEGDGYWVFSDRGRQAGFGVPSLGDVADLDLGAPIVDAAPTASGRGMWLLGADGGVFALGDAPFLGSVPETIPLDDLVRPLIGIIGDPNGRGYWLVAADGGLFSFAAPFRGSLPTVVEADGLDGPVVGGVPYGNGYLLVADDGGVFNFSDGPFLGSLGERSVSEPVTALAAFNT